jgi:hypothetical protein
MNNENAYAYIMEYYLSLRIAKVCNLQEMDGTGDHRLN